MTGVQQPEGAAPVLYPEDPSDTGRNPDRTHRLGIEIEKTGAQRFLFGFECPFGRERCAEKRCESLLREVLII